MADREEITLHKQSPYRRRYKRLKDKANDNMPLWRLLNEFVLPWSGRYLFSDSDTRRSIRRGEQIYNSTTYNAIQTAASGLHGGLTSPSRPWFQLTHPDKELMQSGAVKEWVYDLQESERMILAQSNFYAEIQALYYESLAYGDGVMLLEEDDRKILRCRTLTKGEFFMGAGKDLSINSLYRKFTMTAEQMRDEFGQENLSERVRDHLRNGRLDERIDIIQAIQPWGFFDRKTHPVWSYESVYFEESSGGEDKFLARRGYRTKPFVAVRWGKICADDVYGYGPGEMSLSDIRQLQTMERFYTDAMEWTINPAKVAPASLKNKIAKGDIKPGAVIFAQPGDAKESLRPLMQINFDFNHTRIRIQDFEERIRQAFYNPLFLMINQRERDMTATEIMQLVEEKATVLGPVFEAFQSEIYDPILERLYDIMDNRFGLVRPPPEELAGQELKIEYISLLAQAQKQAGLSNINHFLAITGQIVQINQDPTVLDKVNFDKVFDAVGIISPTDPSIINSDDDVAKIRQSRQQQQEQQAMMQSIPGVAGAARDLSQAVPDENNALGMAAGMTEGAVA